MIQPPSANDKSGYEIPEPWATKFPELVKPACFRPTKHGYVSCGHCLTARAVAWGTTYSKRLPNGTSQPYETEDALRHILQSCSGIRDEKQTAMIVKEIRRDGSRILKPGANVYVQLKRKKGTRKDAGHIVECYFNNTVKVHVGTLGTTVIVPADEYVTGRKGSTKK
tara:strand:+ start:3879 stop:4379 length:501 start_codon:yes stop_codon:yes gene_type:complete